MSYKSLDYYLDELQISVAETVEIFKDTPKQVLPMRDFYSNWSCLDCGSEGKRKGKYKSSLRTRVRAHQNCRCKAWRRR